MNAGNELTAQMKKRAFEVSWFLFPEVTLSMPFFLSSNDYISFYYIFYFFSN